MEVINMRYEQDFFRVGNCNQAMTQHNYFYVEKMLPNGEVRNYIFREYDGELVADFKTDCFGFARYYSDYEANRDIFESEI